MRDRDDFYFRQEYKDREPGGRNSARGYRGREAFHPGEEYSWERWYYDPGRYDQDPGQEDFASQGHGWEREAGRAPTEWAGYRANEQGSDRPELWERRGPHTGRGPRNYTISDGQILADVNEHLMRSGDIDARQVEVQVQAGEVTLNGEVHSRLEKRIAGEIADWVPGVQQVHNELKVTPF